MCELGQLYRQLLEEKEKLVAPETHFGDRDRQALLDNLARKQQDFERQLKDAEDRLTRNESQQTIDLARLDKEHADSAIVTAANAAYRRGRAVACEEITLSPPAHQRTGRAQVFRQLPFRAGRSNRPRRPI